MIAIIAILAGMLLPALNKARDRAKGIACTGNMKQIGTAIVTYAGDNMDYLLISQRSQSASTHSGYWVREITPYLGIRGVIESGLISQFDPQLNRGVFRCPSLFQANVEKTTGYTLAADYCAVGYGWNDLVGASDDSNTASPRLKITKLISSSRKFLLGDTVDWPLSMTWWRVLSRPSTYSQFNSSFPLDCNIGTRHNGGINNIMGDGHVEYFTRKFLMAEKPSGDIQWRWKPLVK